MISIEKLKSSGFFESITLKKGEILFQEGQIDTYLYIIEDGEISIEKNTTVTQWATKKLAKVSIGNIIWEWSISHSKPKEVTAIAQRETSLLRIEWQKKFLEFMNHSPECGFNILKTIIDISNTRVLRANRQILTNFEVNKIINTIEDINYKAIFDLLEHFKKFMEADTILFFESVPWVRNYIKLKYDSRSPEKIHENVINVEQNLLQKSDIEKEEISLEKASLIQNLSIWKTTYGYIVVMKWQHDFDDNDEKILSSICNSFVWIIRQKELQEEEKNKSYMKQV